MMAIQSRHAYHFGETEMRHSHSKTLHPSIHDKVPVVVASGPVAQVSRATTNFANGKGDSEERMELEPAATVSSMALLDVNCAAQNAHRPYIHDAITHISIAAPCHCIDIIINYRTTQQHTMPIIIIGK